MKLLRLAELKISAFKLLLIFSLLGSMDFPKMWQIDCRFHEIFSGVAEMPLRGGMIPTKL